MRLCARTYCSPGAKFDNPRITDRFPYNSLYLNDFQRHYIIIEFEAVGRNRQHKQPVSAMAGGSSQKTKPAEKTVTAGLNLGAVRCGHRTIPECLFEMKWVRCAKPIR